MNTLVIVSGYFNPLHVGHLEYINHASRIGDVCVIVNNDKQVKLKGTFSMMNEKDRAIIVNNLRNVSGSIISVDNDRTVCKSIKKVYKNSKKYYDKIYFAKGGDSTMDNVPELKVCIKLMIPVLFDVGGDKTRNSSDYRKMVIKK